MNPARSSGKDIEEVKREMYLIVSRINEVYGSPDYKPLILIDHPIDLSKKSAYYAVAECCIVTAVRAGMNQSHTSILPAGRGLQWWVKLWGLSRIFFVQACLLCL